MNGRYSERGWACTPPTHQPGLIFPSWWNLCQQADTSGQSQEYYSHKSCVFTLLCVIILHFTFKTVKSIRLLVVKNYAYFSWLGSFIYVIINHLKSSRSRAQTMAPPSFLVLMYWALWRTIVVSSKDTHWLPCHTAHTHLSIRWKWRNRETKENVVVVYDLRKQLQVCPHMQLSLMPWSVYLHCGDWYVSVLFSLSWNLIQRGLRLRATSFRIFSCTQSSIREWAMRNRILYRELENLVKIPFVNHFKS